MRKQFIILLLLGGILAASYTSTASAHILRTDGDFRAEIHVPPYDHPLSGEPTTYLITFENAPEGFSVADCTCNVTVIKQGKTFDTRALAIPDGQESKNTFTFPEAGDYTLRVSGEPKQAGQFPGFTLEYPAHVSPSKPTSKPIPAAVWVGAGTGIVAIVAVALYMDHSGRKAGSKSKSGR